MLDSLNLVALALATIASMAIGAAWYSALAKPWMAANQFSQDQIDQVNSGGSPWIYAVAAVCHLIMAYVLNGVLHHANAYTLFGGVLSAFLIWVGFVATSMTVNHRFQMKPWSLTVIDAGHYLVVLLAQGAILGWFGV